MIFFEIIKQTIQNGFYNTKKDFRIIKNMFIPLIKTNLQSMPLVLGTAAILKPQVLDAAAIRSNNITESSFQAAMADLTRSIGSASHSS